MPSGSCWGGHQGPRSGSAPLKPLWPWERLGDGSSCRRCVSLRLRRDLARRACAQGPGWKPARCVQPLEMLAGVGRVVRKQRRWLLQRFPGGLGRESGAPGVAKSSRLPAWPPFPQLLNPSGSGSRARDLRSLSAFGKVLPGTALPFTAAVVPCQAKGVPNLPPRQRWITPRAA